MPQPPAPKANSERAVAVELFRQAGKRLQQGQLAVAARLAERSREVFVLAGDTEGACAASSLVGRTRVREGRLDAAHAAFTWAQQEAARRGLQARELAALTELGALHELSGELPAAVAVHRTVLERQRARADNVGIAIAAGNVGRLLPRLAPRQEGNPQRLHEDARGLLLEAMQRFETAGNVSGMANALICLGDMERASGRLEAAEQAFSQVVQRTRQEQPALHALALLNLGHVQRDRGRLSEALASLSTSLEVAHGVGDRQGAARARLALAMAGADERPLKETEATFALVEAEFRAIGQPAGVLAATVNRAAILCRLGQLSQGQALLENARSRLETQGDRLAVLEVSLALAEVAITQGDAARAETLLRAVPIDKCPPRLLVRRRLLSARLLLRALQLDQAAALLAEIDPDALSEPERFGLALMLAEIGTLRGDVAVVAALAGLAQGASPNSRDALAVQAAQAADAFWRGQLAVTVREATASAEAWQARGEVLPAVVARSLAWRAALLQGQPLDPADVDAALEVATQADAHELQAGLRLLQAIAAQDLAGISREVEYLHVQGHEAAALAGLLLAGQVTAEPALVRAGTAHLAAATVAVPGWFDVGKPLRAGP